MKFTCRVKIEDGPDEIWDGKIISYTLNKEHLEMYIESKIITTYYYRKEYAWQLCLYT